MPFALKLELGLKDKKDVKNSFCPTFIRLSVASCNGELSQKRSKRIRKKKNLSFKSGYFSTFILFGLA